MVRLLVWLTFILFIGGLTFWTISWLENEGTDRIPQIHPGEAIDDGKKRVSGILRKKANTAKELAQRLAPFTQTPQAPRSVPNRLVPEPLENNIVKEKTALQPEEKLIPKPDNKVAENGLLLNACKELRRIAENAKKFLAENTNQGSSESQEINGEQP